MFVAVLCVSLTGDDAAVARADAAAREAIGALLPEEWPLDGWQSPGVRLLMVAQPLELWDWSLSAHADGRTTLSLGLPVGIPAHTTAAALGARALAGEDVTADVVPPFGMIAVDHEAGTGVVATDWLGMCRMFVGVSDSLLVVASRPSVVARALGASPRPSIDSWAGFAGQTQFPHDTSPVEGVRLMQPGERLLLTRATGARWEVGGGAGRSVDDIIGGAGSRGDEAFDLAAEGMTRVATSLGWLHPDRIVMGLSGGKDSRLLASALISAGVVPKFSTNNDTAAEGETAKQLTDILVERRGLAVEHTFYSAGAPAVVLAEPLEQRTRDLLEVFDFQYPTTYLSRPSVRPKLHEVRPASITGAAGEMASGAWYPKDPASLTAENLREFMITRLSTGLAGDAQSPLTHDMVGVVSDTVIAQGQRLGLDPHATVDLLHLVEKMRRWSSSAYHVGLITPLLTPEFVSAAFSLPWQVKAQRGLHLALIGRLVPEWADIPFVSVSTGRRRATRIWEGDGAAMLTRVVSGADGSLVDLADRGGVEAALRRAKSGKGTRADEGTLAQFIALAMSGEMLGSGTIGPPLPEAPATSAPPKPAQPTPAPKAPPSFARRVVRKMRRTLAR